MFNLRQFIKDGFINAVGQLPNYKIILNSAGWFDKGVLLEEDLAEINEAIKNFNKRDEIVENQDENSLEIDENEENYENLEEGVENGN